MTSTVVKSGAIRTSPAAAAPRSRDARRRALALTGIILTTVVASLGTWRTIDRQAAGDASISPVAASAVAWIPTSSPWLEGVEVTTLERELQRNGYSITLDGNLDPVTKSALADYLLIDAAHPLRPDLARMLAGTVITGNRAPRTWNNRFGLDRVTRFVERPLTGSGGQLDDNGNLRAP